MKSIYLILVLSLVSCGRGYRGHPGYAGKDGQDGKDGTEVLEVLRPCLPNNDILLKLSDGTIIANYDGGPHDDRLVDLSYPNSYGAMDGFSCEFALNENGELL